MESQMFVHKHMISFSDLVYEASKVNW